MSNLKFFIYGTLKKGGRFADKFDDKRISVKSAIARGTMYSVAGGFPAVIFSPKDDEIFGEIHEYEDEKAIQSAFDLIEGFTKKNYTHNLYNRKIITVFDAAGNCEVCQTYEFNRPVVNLPKVKSGFWEVSNGNN